MRLRWGTGTAVLVFGLALLYRVSAQTADAIPADVDRGAGGITRWLHALRTRASMLMVTAHPDDEDGGLLAYETRGAGVRASLLTLNRGEGGQNAMSPDLYDALGLVRTQELRAADRYYGVDQYWARTVDYGFSKTREEALEKWGHDRVLSDAVRVIRMTRPLVITSVFVGAASDGHGHHQLAGEIAQEAYLAAGDPTKFPEQITQEGLRPWTPAKIYERVPIFAVTPQGMYDYAIDKYVPVRFFDYIHQKWSNERPSTTLEIQEGTYSPANGLTYLQIGREGLGFQKSQNSGVSIPAPAAFASPYHRYDSRVPAAEHEETFFDGIDVSVNGIGSLAVNEPDYLKAGLAEIAQFVEQANEQYRPDHPQEIAPALGNGLSATRSLMDKVRGGNLAEPGKSDILFELHAKEDQFEHALAESLGLSLQAAVMPDRQPQGRNPFGGAAPTFTIAIPGQKFGVQVDLLNQSPETIRVESVSLAASDGKPWKIGAENEAKRNMAGRSETQVKFSVTAPADAALTRPYFSRKDEEQAYYDTDPRYRNLSLAPYPLAVTAEVSYRGQTLRLAQVVQTMQRIATLGIVAQPLIVGPAMSVAISPAAGAVPLGMKSFAFSCTVHSNVKGPAEGSVRLRLPAGWRSVPESSPFSFARDGEERTIEFEVHPDVVKSGEYRTTAVAEYQGKTYEEGYRLVGYPGLRPYPYYRPAVYKAVGVDVKTAPGLRIGYLPGTGDDVPTAIENLGEAVRTLAASDVASGNLSGYDAIILGTRAYSVRPELKSANSRLLDYVKNGGVLIVQYNLQEFDQNYGPYPFSLGNNPQKVVDEFSKVKLLKPESPVFTWPNRITEADFGGWVEERGHGFMQTWDAKYEPLLETADPEQDPQRGGLLLARYGKGAYIYDAFALYRQLPTGVPGAYRILANLVSLGKNPAWKAAN